MQNEDYGQLASPISSSSPGAVEVGGDAPSGWPSTSATHGEETFSIGALSLKPNGAAGAATVGGKGERRASADLGIGAGAAAAGAKKSVGWEPVSPGLLDHSPEVVATRRPNDYYWPDAKETAQGKDQQQEKDKQSSSSSSAAAPNLNRRNSKAAELGFQLAGLDGGLTKISNAQFKTLLKTALKSGDLATARGLMTAPLPASVGVVQMFIKRHKSGFFSTLFPTYEVFLEEPQQPFFLMSAKKRTKNKTSNYTISTLTIDMLKQSNSEAALTSEDPTYLGKVRSNFSGSEFVGYDAGINPQTLINSTGANANGPLHMARRPSETKMANVRQELCTVIYENNVMSRCPRKFRVIVPGMLREDPSKRIVCKPLVPSDTLLYQYRALQQSEATEQPTLHEEALAHQEILVMHNKEPVFEPSIQAFCLNFHGRASIASVKNFQLVNCREDKLLKKQNSVVHLQFGKMDKDIFTMDVQYPLSLVQAFEISLAGLDTKLVCD